MSADGSTVVLGAIGSALTLKHSRVLVFRRGASGWTLGATFLSHNTAARTGGFATSVAVSADGSVVAVGAPGRSGQQPNSGGVHRYAETGTGWSYLGPTFVRGAVADEGDGTSLATSADASLLFIGAPGLTAGGEQTGGVYVVG